MVVAGDESVSEILATQKPAKAAYSELLVMRQKEFYLGVYRAENRLDRSRSMLRSALCRLLVEQRRALFFLSPKARGRAFGERNHTGKSFCLLRLGGALAVPSRHQTVWREFAVPTLSDRRLVCLGELRQCAQSSEGAVRDWILPRRPIVGQSRWHGRCAGSLRL